MKTPLLAVLFACLSSSAPAQTPAPPAQAPSSLSIPRVATPPSIEDYLDGTPRPDEVAVTTFVQREPGDGVPSTESTEAYLSYDDTHLYVIFVARDRDPSAVRASLTRREGFDNDDFVGIMLDTFLDRQRAYLFIVNPRGVQRDGVTTTGGRGGDDYSFDTVWDSEGRLTDFGYVTWMAIPFKSLRFPGADTQQWGIALARSIARKSEEVFWPYITRRISRPEPQMAVATGISGISPGRNMQVIPYGAFTGARFLDTDEAAFATETAWRAGIDGKFVVKDAFTIDVTLNPDFSQVESDEPQVTINQRFEVFFQEKRPFFIENASYFQTPINLFFSRRIADPLAGVRLTGKAAGWSVGSLIIDDRAPGEVLEARDPSHPNAGDRAGVAVLRVQRDLPRESNIGVLATTRRFGPSRSLALALDGRWKLNDNWVLTGQAAMSELNDDVADRAGQAFSLNLDRSGRNWGAFVSYEDVSPDFRAPLGFVPRTNFRRFFPFARYTWFPTAGPLLSIRQEVRGGARWDHDGDLLDREAGVELQVEMEGQTRLELGYNRGMERFAGHEFNKHDVSVEARTAWLQWLELSAEAESGREINFFPSAGLAPFLANAAQAELEVTLKPRPQLRLAQTYLFTRLSARDGVPGAAPGAVIVDNHIWRSRASYQFSRSLSLRAIVDYLAVHPDPALIDLEREKTFTADVLATYLVNPWTAFYVGYTDGYGNVAIDPLRPGELRAVDSVFNSTGRQVFVKMSYLLRF